MTASEKNATVFSVKERQRNRLEEVLINEEVELTEWETRFTRSCMNQIQFYDRELSEKQLACLETIEDVVKNGRRSTR